VTLARTRPGRARARRAPGAGHGPAVAGLGLGLLALGPGLRRGFLLSYDMVFVPREPFAAAVGGQAPPRAVPSDLVVAIASRAVPADLVQKAILLSIFVLACAGAARLLDRQPWPARLAAGVYYAWNPYVGERLIIGQWALLLGYAGLPWVLRALLGPGLGTRRGAARLGLALLPAVIGGFAAMAVTGLVVGGVLLAGPSRAAGAGWARRAGVALGVSGAGSLPWLVPAVLRPVYVDPGSVAAFAARADTPFGSLGSLVMLGGGWNAQTVPAGYGGPWSAVWLAVAGVALGGYLLLAWRPRCWPGLGWAAVAGLVIASLGVTAAGRELLRWLISGWPGFAVLRDAQQFVAPLALAEAAGLGLVVAAATKPPPFGRRTGQPGRAGSPDTAGAVLAVAAILAPVLLLPGLAWGAAGRLRPAWYPAGWLAAARAVDASPVPGRVLLLPWETYRTFGWNHGEVVLDPWTRLLSRPLIWDDGTRVGNLELAPDEPAARGLDAAIRGRGPLTAALRAAGVRFVLDDGPAVAARLPGAAVVISQPGLSVYQLPAMSP
jgi:hypothetical protein